MGGKKRLVINRGGQISFLYCIVHMIASDRQTDVKTNPPLLTYNIPPNQIRRVLRLHRFILQCHPSKNAIHNGVGGIKENLVNYWQMATLKLMI